MLLTRHAGTRWTGGAGTVKALHPFVKMRGAFRSFVELHEAKLPAGVPLVVSSSHLTHDALARWAQGRPRVVLSPGRTLGVRMVPMVRDLQCAFAAARHDAGDAQRNKARANTEAALSRWAHHTGEGSDYTDERNPGQALHPCGHWYEVANLLRNGVLARLLSERPALRHLLLHNCDTVGVSVDAALLGQHMASGATLTFEVIRRHADDRGGGLARVNGALRIVEGLALPREELEFEMQFYSTNTTWIDVDRLLAALGLTRAQVLAGDVDAALAAFAARVPTYVTLKDVRRHWGNGQTDTLPVSQHEALCWKAALVPSRFVCVARRRGQQLKDVAQLDGWLRDGYMAYVEQLCGAFGGPE